MHFAYRVKMEGDFVLVVIAFRKPAKGYLTEIGTLRFEADEFMLWATTAEWGPLHKFYSVDGEIYDNRNAVLSELDLLFPV